MFDPLVLVVDDNQEMRELLERALTLEGIRVRTASGVLRARSFSLKNRWIGSP